MMTDRELLELAAKAAGLQIATWGEPDDYSPRNGEVAYIQDDERGWYEWNPLDDDGDALRLAVKLRMNMLFPTAVGKDEIHVSGLARHREMLFNDSYAATRRAIVRAAAEIGRKMK